MGKSFIHVVLIFIGGILLLKSVSNIQKSVIHLISEGNYTVSVSSFIAYLFFSLLGLYLVRLGYRKMYPPEDKESIEDIGDR